MSLNANGSTFTMPVPGMTVVDNKTGMNINLESGILVSSTTQNDLESTKQAFMKLMELYTKTPQFEQTFRDLNSDVNLNVIHSITTFY